MSLRTRPMTSDDYGFVVDSWRNSYEGAPAVHGADREHFRVTMEKTIARLLEGATVLVRCDERDPSTIVGWVAFTGSELHWGYVKRDFRKECHLADILEGVAIDSYTYRGRILEQLLEGIGGCRFSQDERGKYTWHPPKGWRFTPRI